MINCVPQPPIYHRVTDKIVGWCFPQFLKPLGFYPLSLSLSLSLPGLEIPRGEVDSDWPLVLIYKMKHKKGLGSQYRRVESADDSGIYEGRPKKVAPWDI